MIAATPDNPRGCGWLHVAAAALLLTALNAAKPVHIDDRSYVVYGAEFAAHPLDPYAFDYGIPLAHPANGMLMPPVVIYWLGLVQLVLGDSPALLKCWLFPFALLLAAAVDFLAGRASPSLRAPVLWLAVLSPSMLPGFNLMLDTPVAALGVAAVAAAARATDRNSIGLALAAGALAALAVQTKYTGAVAAAAVVLWFALNRRFAFAALSGLTAVALLVGWEWFVARTQGESHFLIQLRQRQGKPLDRVFNLVLPLVSQAAGLAPAVALLGWAALRPRVVPVLAAVVVVAFAALALTDSQAALVTTAAGKAVLTPSNLVYGVLALVVWPALVGVCVRLVRGDALDRFLVAWLALEVAGYFALSPFPAARRLGGPLLVMTLAAGRLAHRTGVAKRTAAAIGAAGAALALVVFAADAADARAARDAARLAARSHAPAAGGTYWHFCWWGVGYYAEREGLRQLQLNRGVPRAGDLIAVHDVPEIQQFMRIQPLFRVELLEPIEVGDRFPLRACPGYYDGRTPLESARGARTRVFVYRVVVGQPEGAAR